MSSHFREKDTIIFWQVKEKQHLTKIKLRQNDTSHRNDYLCHSRSPRFTSLTVAKIARETFPFQVIRLLSKIDNRSRDTCTPSVSLSCDEFCDRSLSSCQSRSIVWIKSKCPGSSLTTGSTSEGQEATTEREDNQDSWSVFEYTVNSEIRGHEGINNNSIILVFMVDPYQESGWLLHPWKKRDQNNHENRAWEWFPEYGFLQELSKWYSFDSSLLLPQSEIPTYDRKELSNTVYPSIKLIYPGREIQRGVVGQKDKFTHLTTSRAPSAVWISAYKPTDLSCVSWRQMSNKRKRKSKRIIVKHQRKEQQLYSRELGNKISNRKYHREEYDPTCSLQIVSGTSSYETGR